MVESVETDRRSPGRPRKAEVLRERRARSRERGEIVGGRRLGALASILDRVNFVYRWFNDDEVRMFAHVAQGDWVVCTKDGGEVEPDSTDYGQAVWRMVGRGVNGAGMKAYLCRKPREWYEEDKRKDQEAIDETNRMINRGAVLGANGEVSDPRAAGMYVVPGSHVQGEK